MSRGPDHYAAAEAAIERARDIARADSIGPGRPLEAIAVALTALADALLALTSATIETAPTDPNTIDPTWHGEDPS